MDILINAFIGAAIAYSFWIWLGEPNGETGEYSTDMILSNVGKWLLVKWHESQNKLYKLPMCPYCFSVWVAFFVAITQTTALYAILSAACTAPFVSLFFYLRK